MADYFYSEMADQDLQGIAEYTLDYWGIQQTRAYRKAIDQAASTVAMFPSMGGPYQARNGETYQKYSVGEHALFYQHTESGVFIARVLHLRMDFDQHL